MVFGNLLKPSNLKRFLLALAAGTVAIVIYFTAEHFQVIPGTAALDEEAPRPPALGGHSVAVMPVAGACGDDPSAALALETARHLVRIPEIEVIAPRSALALPRSPGEQQKGDALFETAWVLEITCRENGGDAQLSAWLRSAKGDAPVQLSMQENLPGAYPDLISDVLRALPERFGIAPLEAYGNLESLEPTAYRDFLHARLLLLKGASSAAQAEELLARSLELSPDWAPAIAAQAYARLQQPQPDPQAAEAHLQRIRADLDRAVQLDPGNPEAHLYLGMIAHRFDWDWQKAFDETSAALATAPGDAGILAAASTAAFTLGRFDEGVEWLRKAIPLDPLVLSHRLKYGLMLEFSGQPRAAIEAYRELKVIDPYYPGVHAYLGRALIVGERIKLAPPHMEYERDAFWRKYGTVLALYAMERNDEADDQFQRFIEQHGDEAAVQIAEIKAYSGRIDEAFDWLQRAVDQRDPGVSELVGNPLLQNLASDPRWPKLLEMLGLPAGVLQVS